jgi:hypothetical protein
MYARFVIKAPDLSTRFNHELVDKRHYMQVRETHKEKKNSQ